MSDRNTAPQAPCALSAMQIIVLAVAAYRAPLNWDHYSLRRAFRAEFVPAPPADMLLVRPLYVRCLCCGTVHKNPLGLTSPVVYGCAHSACVPTTTGRLETALRSMLFIEEGWRMLRVWDLDALELINGHAIACMKKQAAQAALETCNEHTPNER